MFWRIIVWRKLCYWKNCFRRNSFLDRIRDFEKLRDKIILIESADPGYDFIFSYNIKGLITKYGGRNSHMSIRCNELSLPSIIGVGEKIYNNFFNCNKIYIDCNNRRFETFV